MKAGFDCGGPALRLLRENDITRCCDRHPSGSKFHLKPASLMMHGLDFQVRLRFRKISLL